MLIEGFPKERLINSRTTNRDSCTYKTPPIAIYYKQLVMEETQVCKIYTAKKGQIKKKKNLPKKEEKVRKLKGLPLAIETEDLNKEPRVRRITHNIALSQ